MENKKLRCPLGVLGGILAALISLAGIIYYVVNFDLFSLLISIALLLVAMPFIRVTMMVHTANDRLDEIEKKLEKK
jgi:ABC-type Na+ efflux pump permease subunit